MNQAAVTPAISTTEEFKNFANDFWLNNKKPAAYGIGITYRDSSGNHIATKWFSVNKSSNKNLGTAAVLLSVLRKTKSLDKVCSAEMIDDMLFHYFGPFENDGRYHQNIEALKKLKVTVSKDTTPVISFYYSEKDLLENPIKGIGDAHFRLALTATKEYGEEALYTKNLLKVLPVLVWTKESVFTPSDWDQMENKKMYGETSMGKFPPLDWTITTKK